MSFISSNPEETLTDYMDLYELAPVGYLVLSAEGVIENINLTGAALFDSERGSLLNQSFTTLVYAENKERWQLFFWNLLRFNVHKSAEMTLTRADDSLLYVQLDGISFIDKQHRHKVRLVLTDISERKQAEIALKEAITLAENANRLRSKFLANMSHEIRTPMNAIVGMAYLLQDSELTENQHAYLNKINVASHKLLGIINNILDFCKIEAGQITLKQERFLLDNLFSRLADRMYVQAQEKNLELMFSISPSIPNHLIGDTLRLNQVLFNLLNNAVKFSNRGNILVSVVPIEQNPDSVLLQFSVQDSGCGMTPEQVKRLFQPFSQASILSRANKQGGTGLGLAISQELIAMMGGKIKVKSHVDLGSIFSFTIRLDIAEPCFVTQVTAQTTDTRINLAGKRVLLVEDDEFNCILTAEILRRLEIEVVTAENGLQAIWRIKNQEFDLVLMDVQMPEMDGLAATRLLRAEKRFQHLPVIALTANSTNSDRERCLIAGMNDYLCKPINPLKLVEILSYWLKNAP